MENSESLSISDAFELSISDYEPIDLYPPEELLPARQSSLPPWAEKYAATRGSPYTGSALKQLEAELKDYYNWITLKQPEIKCREALISRLSSHIVKLFGEETSILKFGSYSLDLSIPTSDIDLVVYNLPLTPAAFDCEISEFSEDNCVRSGHNAIPVPAQLSFCKSLYNSLLLDKSFTVVEFISGARIPIIKGLCAHTGLHFDISMSGSVVSEHREMAEQLIAAHPRSKQLIMIMKHFLAQRSLDVPFTGGVGGYVLINMIAAFYEAKYRMSYAQRDDYDCQYAADLLGFLEFYTYSFGSHITAIDIARFYSRNVLVPKSQLSRVERYVNDFRKITIIDPAGQPAQSFESVDVGGAAYNWHLIKKSMSNGYNVLLCETSTTHNQTRLSNFVRDFPPMATVRALCWRHAKSDNETRSMSPTPSDSTPPSPLRVNSKTVSQVKPLRKNMTLNIL